MQRPKSRCCDPHGPARSRGFVLVAILWFVALIALLAGAFAAETHARARHARVVADAAAAKAMAEGAVWRTIFTLAGTLPMDERLRHDGVPIRWEARQGEVLVAVQAEAGRIDLNRADAALLDAVLAGVEPDERTRLAMVDAVLDWRDADDLRRVHGAEAEDYRRDGLAWLPANRPFADVRELALVRGFRPEQVERLRPMLTVHSGSGTVDRRVAPPEVLLALPGATAGEVDSWLARRDSEFGAQRGPVRVGTGPYEVRAMARTESGVAYAARAVVRVRRGQAVPYAILEWDHSAWPAGAERPGT